MLEICIYPSPCISESLKYNAIRLNYYCMIVRQQKTPTAAFFASILTYRKCFPETPMSMVSLKLSNILNQNLNCDPIQLKNNRRQHFDDIIASDL